MILKEYSEEKLFTIIMLITGLILIFLLPPMTTPDERAHFVNSYTISYGDIFPEYVDGKVGKYVNTDAITFMNENNLKYTGKLETKYTFSEMYFDSWLPNSNTETSFMSLGKHMEVNPIGYIISSTGMFFGRIASYILGEKFLSPYNSLLFGKMANLFFYVFIGAFAIKRTIYLKKTMIVLLLLPMNIYLGSTISYDAILIPICCLYFAEIMRLLRRNNTIYKKDIMIICICAFFMVGIKMAYAPLLLLLLLIPKENYTSKKQYKICILSFLLVCFIAYFIPKFLLYLSLNGQHQALETSIKLQYDYFSKHFLEFPMIFFNSLKQYYNYYLVSFYGKLGELDVNFPVPFLTLGIISLIFIIISESFEYDKVKLKVKISILFIVSIIVIAIFLTMYLNWTPLVETVGGSLVSGVQGRYFSPLFLFIVTLFTNNLIKNKKIYNYSRKITGNLTMFMIFLNPIITIFVLLIRFW